MGKLLAGFGQQISRWLGAHGWWILAGAVVGWLANVPGLFLGGLLWPLGGAVVGLAASYVQPVRGLATRVHHNYGDIVVRHLLWIACVLVGLLLAADTSVKLVDTVAIVVVAVAVAVGYFVEANAWADLAPRWWPGFVAISGALVGAVVGWLVNSGGWFLGGPLWPLGGAVVFAVLGVLTVGRTPPPDDRRLRISERLRPPIFLAPVVVFVGGALVVPAVRTIYLSFFTENENRDTKDFVGLENYGHVFTDDSIFSFNGFGDVLTSRLFIAGALLAGVAMLWVVLRGVTTRRGVDMSAPLPVVSLTTTAGLVVLAMMGALTGVLWNNFFWIVLATGFCTIVGLAIAVLADRAKGETLAKSLIFMPMAISFVGASVIWRFVYAWTATEPIGVLNGVWVGFGGEQQNWITTEPWNDLILIVIMIWVQSGFAMVVLSAAIKGVPAELQEAARVDGATEGQTFWRITVPHIRSTLAVVITTLIVTVLKIYDIVKVMTNGEEDTNVIANRMFNEAFEFGHRGLGSTLAVLLFMAVVPLMIINVRRMRRAEGVA